MKLNEKKSFTSSAITKPSVNKNEDNQTDVDPNEQREELDEIAEEDKEELKDAEDDGKDTKFKRRDVILKTVLRKCRKFYQKKFNSHTKFLKNKKKELSSYYKNCIEQFIAECLPFDTNLNLSFHMGALLYPQEMIRSAEKFVFPNGTKSSARKKLVKKKVKVYQDQVDILHDILYKFSREKLERFLAIPELAYIFLYYIENGGEED
mmetsp:Transcript_20481/g.23650  ORF Transcript_20481/g.23650 Transcript_20481/m.23650 type:complete len:207 (-) Transcript_20481:103-723(-)